MPHTILKQESYKYLLYFPQKSAMLVLKESNIQSEIYRVFFYVRLQYDIKRVICIHTAT